MDEYQHFVVSQVDTGVSSILAPKTLYICFCNPKYVLMGGGEGGCLPYLKKHSR